MENAYRELLVAKDSHLVPSINQEKNDRPLKLKKQVFFAKMATQRYKIACKILYQAPKPHILSLLGMGRFSLYVCKIWSDLGQPGESR